MHIILVLSQFLHIISVTDLRKGLKVEELSKGT